MENRDLFDLGLQADLSMLRRSGLSRRDVLKLGFAGIAALLTGCATPPEETQAPLPASTATRVLSPTQTPSPTQDPTSTAESAPQPTDEIDEVANACPPNIPRETAGPFPADGSKASSQMLNVLTIAGVVRPDIRTSLVTKHAAAGVPMTLEMTLVNTNRGCAPLAGYAVYIWHCDRDGNYSMYSPAVTDEDYLRGVQVTDANGKLSFTTIFPGCYPGRWPHIHFEVYPSLEKATDARFVTLTSQLAFPADACRSAYSAAGYESSIRSLSELSLETDGVFRDGYAQQLAATSGNPAKGYSSHLTVGIPV